MKTVKDVSKITGISIRTLRYYDEIGLLKPTRLTDAGYRLYDDKALEKLQEIMFFRELEIPLAEIKKILEDPLLDKEQLLAVQKSMLERKRNRLSGIIELISDVMKGVNTMSFDEFNEKDAALIIENMKNGLSEEQLNEFVQKYGGGSIDAYQDKLIESLNDDANKTSLLKWYGSKENIIKGYQPVQQDMDKLRKELDKLHKEFFIHIGCIDSETEHSMVERLVNLYKQMLSMDNARNFLIDLSKEYLQGGQLAKVQDQQYGEGTTKYIAEAIQRYYGI